MMNLGNGMSPMQFASLLKNRNPQDLVMSLVQNSNFNNPILSNLITYAQKGDVNSITKVAEEMFNKQGKNFNQEFNNFMDFLN